MPFFEEAVLTDSIEIETTPDKIFGFLTDIVDDRTYKNWHKKDHVSFKWLKGIPWAEGSIVYAEEYFHGKLHKLTFIIEKNVKNKQIIYVPRSRLLRLFFPKNEFLIEQNNGSCRFIATATYRIGWIGKKLFKKSIDKGLASVRQHMKEEGENLERLLESR